MMTQREIRTEAIKARKRSERIQNEIARLGFTEDRHQKWCHAMKALEYWAAQLPEDDAELRRA